MLDQDRAEEAYRDFQDAAREKLVGLMFAAHPDAILDAFLDDVMDAVGDRDKDLLEAIQSSDSGTIGDIMMNAMNRVADQLVTDDKVNERCQEWAATP